MSSYLFFKSSGFLCESLTEQHPFTRLPHMIRPRLFVQAHRGISPVDSRIQPARSAGHDFEGITELTMLWRGPKAAPLFLAAGTLVRATPGNRNRTIQSCSGTIQELTQTSRPQ